MSDVLSKVYNAVAHPVEKEPIEHNASHGASLQEHDPPAGFFNRMTSDETTKQIKSQGNNGAGMDDGLRSTAIAQQERVAERSRLQAEGMFEPHMKHDDLVNLSPEHRAVADGTKLHFDD